MYLDLDGQGARYAQLIRALKGAILDGRVGVGARLPASRSLARELDMSLGECETDAHSDGSDAADDQLFATAVAQGQTFSISTGDSGADECGDGGTKASNPANSPYVVAVAGTTLNASTTAWPTRRRTSSSRCRRSC